MDTDDDIAASLPQPPPPAPARRDAAIEAAMRRFDGKDDAARAIAPRQRPTPWWTQLRSPQLGALVSAALVALVGVPAIWLSMSDQSRPAQNATIYADQNASEAAPLEAGPQPPPPPIATTAPDVAAGTVDTAQVAPPEPAPPALAQVDIAPLASPAPALKVASPAPPPPPPPPAPADEIVATASRRAEQREDALGLARRAPPAAVASALAPKMAAAETQDHSIVVTGSRVKRKPAGRGDWNACTINDPSQNLRGCGSLVNPGAKGETGRAAAHVSDGLVRAWKGDMDGAIAAFDQAIAASPRNAFAYLNRGLARQRNGEADGALADLDRAVRLAPRTARAYYNRSLLLRERGDTRRARADEERAVGIDPTYDAVVQ